MHSKYPKNPIKFFIKACRKIFSKSKHLIFRIKHLIFRIFYIENLKLLSLWLYLICIALYARYFAKRAWDVGLGPEPMINNLYHKKALELFGYSVQTFVTHTYFITQTFDYHLECQGSPIAKAIDVFSHIVFNYKILYTYFNGTITYLLPGHLPKVFRAKEAWLYKLARVKIVVMPYGGDVHNLSYCPNLLMKNGLIKDYPFFQKSSRDHIIIRLDAWTKYADHVISGCDWVWFMYHWDTLLSGHFSIDTNSIQPVSPKEYKKGDLIKIFHAPNHLNTKGSQHFINAINELKDEGYNVEIVFVQKKPNHEILKIMSECDIVADQLMIGWYAMTALEGMALGKPVLCYLHPDLLDLYCEQKVLQEEDIALVNCNFRTIKTTIKKLVEEPHMINEIGKKSRQFVEKYHSIEYIGQIFDRINQGLEVYPTHLTNVKK